MTLWARQHAWLSAEKGRWEKFNLPPVRSDFLPQCLIASGPVEQTGFGAVGISPQRLESWMRITGYALSPWQAETVLDASRAYADELSGERPSPPWVDGLDSIKAAQAIKAALRLGMR